MFRRLATVKDDGTVQFEVPGDIKPQGLEFGTGIVSNEATDVESVDMAGFNNIPPLQIVILIVGTRGDVQPFVAIGKRLQVMLFFVCNQMKQSCASVCNGLQLLHDCIHST